MTANPNTGSEKRRRRRRTEMRARYDDLRFKTPIDRIQMMEEEFGPYWAVRMLSDDSVPWVYDSQRYKDWLASKPEHQKKEKANEC